MDNEGAMCAMSKRARYDALFVQFAVAFGKSNAGD